VYTFEEVTEQVCGLHETPVDILLYVGIIVRLKRPAMPQVMPGIEVMEVDELSTSTCVEQAM
jgi:hypothetical protein